jgi:hypothetical protein
MHLVLGRQSGDFDGAIVLLLSHDYLRLCSASTSRARSRRRRTSAWHFLHVRRLFLAAILVAFTRR